MTPRGKEKDCVQLAVRQYLELRGWRVHRLTSDLRPGVGAHRADREPAGTPDLVAIKIECGTVPEDGGTLIRHVVAYRVRYIECKRSGETLSPVQRAMHDHLRAQGYRVITVTGADAAEAVANLEAQL